MCFELVIIIFFCGRASGDQQGQREKKENQAKMASQGELVWLDPLDPKEPQEDPVILDTTEMLDRWV